MDGQRRGDGGCRMEDEFACPGMLRGSLASLRGPVERVFGVRLDVGDPHELPHVDGSDGDGGQIWLKLSGPRDSVPPAKLFIRGLVHQEQQQEVPYPKLLHCVFCGARGLFMDCLTRNTSAHILVGSQGCLLISGLTEPVVQAFSLVADLVERCKGTQGRRVEAGDRAPGESLDVRRAFKALVEIREDKYALDLLVLPWAVKEALLALVEDSGLGLGPAPHSSGMGLAPGTAPHSGLGMGLHSGMGLAPGTALHSSGMGLVPGPAPHFGLGPSAGGEGGGLPMDAFFSPADSARQDSAGRPGPQALRAAPLNRAEPPEGAAPCPFFYPAGSRGRVDMAEGELGEMEEGVEGGGGGGEEGELLLSVGSRKEFGLLLKFFTAMGYTEAVVERVLARTGPREASQILDLVQQEQDRSDRACGRERNLPSETEEGEVGGDASAWQRKAAAAVGRGPGGDGSGVVGGGRKPTERWTEEEEAQGGEDFVLGVMKRAAASCGYMEEKVAAVYSMLPDLSTHRLILELQRGGAGEEELPEGPSEVDDDDDVAAAADAGVGRAIVGGMGPVREEAALLLPQPPKADAAPKEEKKKKKKKKMPAEQRGAGGGKLPAPSFSSYAVTPRPQDAPPRPSPDDVRGPPLLTYAPVPSALFAPHHPAAFAPNSNHAPPRLSPQAPPPSTHHTPYPQPQNKPPRASPIHHVPSPGRERSVSPRKHPPPPHQLLQQLVFPAPPPSSSMAKGAVATGAVVTGEQRFLEGLQLPFDLQLTDLPGDPELRMVIIDGSNVAMSHGLGHFFSCRGIALAVQHFWNRGHRQITTFLPQWRQKRDPNITEQHFLTQLQNLGLVSYTPSREVQGKRINSYDDRFMLQLAQKTDGVIVTNDNLRDLLNESAVWRDIIKKRLLQYTFVGDHFMVPDDPLGRGGPHLNDFLRSLHRTPDPGSHSFAGIGSFPCSKPSRSSKTEVLQFRDRTPRGVVDAEFRESQAQPLGRGQGLDKTRAPSPGLGPERSSEETRVLRESLCQVFPGQESMVTLVLQSHPQETDVNALSHLILEQQGD